MNSNKFSVLAFCVLIGLVGFLSAPHNAEGINAWLKKEFGAHVGLSSEIEATEETPSAASDEQTPEATAMEEPAAEAGEAVEAKGAEDAAEATSQPEEAAAAAEETPSATADEAVQAGVVIPSFGLLRVEPDGSMVIAGQAAPNATIEVLSGSDTIATTTAEPNGDFVAVLDEPLAPGDYDIVLRAIQEDGDVAMSEETAIVSVPEPGREGEVLALVERPGEPSRLINTPKPSDTGTAEAAPETGEAEEVAETETVEAAEEATEVAAAEEPSGTATEEAASETAEATEETAEAQVEGTEPAEEETEVAAADTSGEPMPAETASQPVVGIAAVEIENDMVFVAGVAPSGAQVRVYANEFLLGDTVAGPGGEFLVEARRSLPVGDYIIRADVIDPGTAEVLARAAVPFTRTEGERIAAVAGPATVSEEQPAGEPETAQAEPAAPEATADAATPKAATEEPTPDAQTETAEALPAGSPDTADTDAEVASAEAEPAATVEAASEDTETAADAAPADASQDVAAAGEPASEETQEAAVAPEEASTEADTEVASADAGPAKPSETASAEAETEAAADAVAEESVAEASTTGEPAAEERVAEASASEDVTEPAAEAQAEAEAEAVASPQGEAEAAEPKQVAVVVPPKPSVELPVGPPEVREDIVVRGTLHRTNSAVIIRRGDTLWHISRRVYGQGIRYTTIYLANQPQIRDPDRIWPGQIFELPKKAADE